MNGLPYQAFLNWGDGSQPTPLNVGFVTEGIAPNLTSYLTVTGLASHKFAHSGAHVVMLTIRDTKSSDPAFQATMNAYVVLHS
jgi:hypothetical protein